MRVNSASSGIFARQSHCGGRKLGFLHSPHSTPRESTCKPTVPARRGVPRTAALSGPRKPRRSSYTVSAGMATITLAGAPPLRASPRAGLCGALG